MADSLGNGQQLTIWPTPEQIRRYALLRKMARRRADEILRVSPYSLNPEQLLMVKDDLAEELLRDLVAGA